MNILKSVEQKLEGLVEGVFGRAFKASVQPVELAHKLAKELGDHKIVGPSHVYVPNEFEIYLGHDDYEHLTSFADSLKAELSSYVSAFARREGWTMVAPPRIELREDTDLRVGEFGIATRTVDPQRAEEYAVSAAAGGPAPVAPSPPITPVVPAGAAMPPAAAAGAGVAAGAAIGPGHTVLYERPPVAAAGGVLRGDAGVFELAQDVTVLGRSRRCDIVLTDPNVSRQHAEVRRAGGEFVVRDLDSTNGLRVNGRVVKQATLRAGDRVELGTTELRFERRS
ncbi:MAG TPA: DUF3662 and FHA domain-containing protein [Thermoleophilia bacterium]|nr:DUF3662 and FHA domain-containing protein [Thermoleophilia bacterium]